MKAYFNGEPLKGLYFNGDRVGDVVTPPDEPSEPVTPTEDPYHGLRPSDWLPMPMPAENEMYLLMMLPSDGPSYLSFTTVTIPTSAGITVEIGTVVDGEFVSGSSAEIESGVKCEITFSPDDFGNLTSDGYKQAMVKVSSTGSIQQWSPSTLTEFDNNKKTNYVSWRIVEIACNLPESTQIRCCASITGNSNSLLYLKFYAQYGENNLSTMYLMFTRCVSLIGVLSLDVSKVVNLSNAFSTCYSLIFLPNDLEFSNVTSLSNAFFNCTSLTKFPNIDTSKATTFINAFAYCDSLRGEATIDMASCVISNYGYVFSNCKNIRKLTLKNLSTYATTLTEMCWALEEIVFDGLNFASNDPIMLDNLYNLRSIKFVNCGSDVIWSLSITNCAFTKEDIVELFTALPTTGFGGAGVVDLTGNPCGSPTGDVLAIAQEKGWTLIY